MFVKGDMSEFALNFMLATLVDNHPARPLPFGSNEFDCVQIRICPIVAHSKKHSSVIVLSNSQVAERDSLYLEVNRILKAGQLTSGWHLFRVEPSNKVVSYSSSNRDWFPK